MLNIKSKITEKVLGYYFLNKDDKRYVNELARILDVDPGNLDRKLKELEKAGILESQTRGNLKFFFLNKNYPLLKELKNIYKAQYGIEKKMADVFRKLKGLKEAYIFGSYAKGGFGPESDIDILLIGDHSSMAAKRLIAKLRDELKREFNIVDMTEKELQQREKKGDDFIKNIFKNKIIKLDV